MSAIERIDTVEFRRAIRPWVEVGRGSEQGGGNVTAMQKVLAGIRALCVDDEADNLELVSAVLARQGAEVSTCTSAEKAVAMLRAERFDVVVSDLSMPPGLDGYDLAHALRAMESADPTRLPTPAVALSGDALRPSRKRRFADFQVYMRKPFESARLVHIVDRLVEADAEAVRSGSLGIWEAKQATVAAATATAVAVNASAAAADATTAAVASTAAAERASVAASAAEVNAASAAARAPPALNL